MTGSRWYHDTINKVGEEGDAWVIYFGEYHAACPLHRLSIPKWRYSERPDVGARFSYMQIPGTMYISRLAFGERKVWNAIGEDRMPLHLDVCLCLHHMPVPYA